MPSMVYTCYSGMELSLGRAQKKVVDLFDMPKEVQHLSALGYAQPRSSKTALLVENHQTDPPYGQLRCGRQVLGLRLRMTTSGVMAQFPMTRDHPTRSLPCGHHVKPAAFRCLHCSV